MDEEIKRWLGELEHFGTFGARPGEVFAAIRLLYHYSKHLEQRIAELEGNGCKPERDADRTFG